ncbi:MAG: hypothetical protein P8L79_06645 [Rhodospirillaceae bacterium]|jgi:hypothetical protein|nr:hypothetical protein [Rhodospirillaceae bacterium]
MTTYQPAVVRFTKRTLGFIDCVEESAQILSKYGAEYVARGPAKKF